MSTMEYKVVLRVCDENISSKREHLEYMRRITGQEPTWIEGEDSEEDMDFNFSYQPLMKDGRRVHHTSKDEPFFMEVADGALYGVDLVLAWTVDDPPVAVFHCRTVQRHLMTISDVTGCNAELVTYLFYGWYNGGDEPVIWSGD